MVRQYKKSSNYGFTLIELMIALVIIAILVSVAYPSYQDSVRKARRGDAQANLIQFSALAERQFTEVNDFTGLAAPANTDGYTYDFLVVPSATAYTVRANPTAIQNDDGCGTMTLSETGQRISSGPETGCW